MDLPSEFNLHRDSAQLIELIKNAKNKGGYHGKWLQSCEIVPGFTSVCFEIALMDDQESGIRLLALLSVKNAITRQWNKRNNLPLICQTDRMYLKTKLLELTAMDELLFNQIIEIVVFIARSDWPNGWKDIFPTLLTVRMSICLLKAL